MNELEKYRAIARKYRGTEASAAIIGLISKVQERNELFEGFVSLADNVHALLCWEHDYGQPPSSLDALITARAIIAKVENHNAPDQP